MTRFRLPIRFRDSGEVNYIEVENADVRNARKIFARIERQTKSFAQCAPVQRWKWDNKTETRGKWVDA